jgi:hypothetical protein
MSEAMDAIFDAADDAALPLDVVEPAAPLPERGAAPRRGVGAADATPLTA